MITSGLWNGMLPGPKRQPLSSLVLMTRMLSGEPENDLPRRLRTFRTAMSWICVEYASWIV